MAAVLQMQLSEGEWGEKIDWAGFRAGLGIEPEPPIDPLRVNIDEVPLARLGLIPVEELDDERLVKLYRRAREWGIGELVVKSARQIVDRAGLAERMIIPAISLYGDIAVDAFGKGDREAALEWIRRGRAAEVPAQRTASAPYWDMMEIQFRAYLDDPEEWVPDLAVVLDRYQNNGPATLVLTSRLIEMGLIRLAPVPDRPTEVQLDPRPLQQLLRAVRAEGHHVLGLPRRLGDEGRDLDARVGRQGLGSAIWTPGSDAGGAGAGEKPRIILPGQ